MNWIRISIYLWPAMVLSWLTLSGILALCIIGCIVADVVRKLIERRAVHVQPWDRVDNGPLLLWGTIQGVSDRPIRFFRVRFPLSVEWRFSDYGHFDGWHERQLVWTETRGWFEWFEPVTWAREHRLRERV